MGPWAHGDLGPWGSRPTGPWAHGPLGTQGPLGTRGPMGAKTHGTHEPMGPMGPWDLGPWDPGPMGPHWNSRQAFQAQAFQAPPFLAKIRCCLNLKKNICFLKKSMANRELSTRTQETSKSLATLGFGPGWALAWSLSGFGAHLSRS